MKSPISRSDKKCMKILLVDDSVDTGLLVTRSLSPYEVDQALNLREAGELLAQSEYHLILIDVQLPDGNGFQFCDQLAKNGRYETIPRIFLTGQGETSDKVFGLNSGADDYITKPFASAELKARVDSRLRRKAGTSLLRLYGFELNSDFHSCLYRDGDNKTGFDLTPTEYRIFLALLRAEGRPLSRGEIVRAVWKSHGFNIEERGVDTHIAHLRKKLGTFSDQLVSVYGKGYAFVATKAAA